jgi:hypothetical protein
MQTDDMEPKYTNTSKRLDRLYWTSLVDTAQPYFAILEK